MKNNLIKKIVLAAVLCLSAGFVLSAQSDASSEKKAQAEKLLENQFAKIKLSLYEGNGLEDIYVMKTEMTQQLYKLVTGENPSSVQGDKLPVTDIKYKEACLFCNELSQLMGLTPVYKIGSQIWMNSNANGFRLLSNDEWAACAVCNKSFNFSGSSNIDEVAWYLDNSEKTVHPVAQKRPNAYGLFDMTGNVKEWTCKYGAPDVKTSASDSFLCSTDYLTNASNSRLFYCYRNSTEATRYGFVGFRICRNVPEDEK